VRRRRRRIRLEAPPHQGHPSDHDARRDNHISDADDGHADHDRCAIYDGAAHHRSAHHEPATTTDRGANHGTS
jgi:hypothetical protein